MRSLSIFCLAIIACGVADPPATTGGVPPQPKTTCGEAFVVAGTDYASTNVSVVAFDGRVLSSSFASSASRSTGSSAALSGDVVLPLETPASGEVVLLDRYPNSVVTWIDPRTAKIRAQLNVSTGFPSNPHDYVEIDANKAYVSRYESNPSPGRQPFDEGGDLLIVDPRAARITGRVSLPSGDPELLPRADRMTRVGASIVVLLQRFDRAFKKVGDARLAVVDPSRDAVVSSTEISGMASCGGVARAGNRLVVGCSGAFGTGDAQLDRSAVIVFDTTTLPPREVRRHLVARALGGPVSASLALANERVVVGSVFGDLASGRGDQAFALDLETGDVRVLAKTRGAFVLGDARCCGGGCALADAEAGGLQLLRERNGALEASSTAKIGDPSGLSPRYVGSF